MDPAHRPERLGRRQRIPAFLRNPARQTSDCCSRPASTSATINAELEAVELQPNVDTGYLEILHQRLTCRCDFLALDDARRLVADPVIAVVATDDGRIEMREPCQQAITLIALAVFRVQKDRPGFGIRLNRFERSIGENQLGAALRDQAEAVATWTAAPSATRSNGAWPLASALPCRSRMTCSCGIPSILNFILLAASSPPETHCPEAHFNIDHALLPASFGRCIHLLQAALAQPSGSAANSCRSTVTACRVSAAFMSAE